MADLRIVDAPVLLQESITDDVKMPTGGLGNYAIRLGDLVWYVVTKEQLANKNYVNLSTKGVKDSLDEHIADKNNPHQVTKEQVGLGNVDNTADIDKPVSNAVSSAITTATNDMATKTYVNSKVSSLTDNKADKATTLAGYGIIDAYTKSEIDTDYSGVKTLYGKNVEAGAGAAGWIDSLITVDAESNETQKTLNEYFLKSIFDIKERLIDLENDIEDFSTLEKRLTDSILAIDFPMKYDSAINMSFDVVPSYESKSSVTGTVSGINFADYRVELYVVTSKEYYWKTAEISVDGKWAFANSNTGSKQVRLIHKSDGAWVHTLEIPICVRSHRMTQSTDPAVAETMGDRAYTYDQAVVACAMIAQNHPSMNHYVKGLLAIVGNDGSVPFYVHRISAFVSRKYYRSGNAAWVYYALAYYLKKFPQGTYATEAQTKLLLGLNWIERFFISNPSDIRYGLYSGGSGRFIDGGTVFEESYQVYWCACEHNMDMWFVLSTAVSLGFTQFTERRDLVKNSIVNKLWSATDNRLYTGINEFGIDKTKYLDTSSWGGLFLLASGELEKGKACEVFLETYRFSTIEASGYTPYLKQNRTKGIWVEGSCGAALYYRALGKYVNNLNIIAKMRALLTPYGYRDSLIDPNDKTLTLWEQSCNTAWVLLAYKPNGFMSVN